MPTDAGSVRSSPPVPARSPADPRAFPGSRAFSGSRGAFSGSRHSCRLPRGIAP